MKPGKELDLGLEITWPICSVCGDVPWCSNSLSDDCGYQVDPKMYRHIWKKGGESNERDDGTS